MSKRDELDRAWQRKRARERQNQPPAGERRLVGRTEPRPEVCEAAERRRRAHENARRKNAPVVGDRAVPAAEVFTGKPLKDQEPNR